MPDRTSTPRRLRLALRIVGVALWIVVIVALWRIRENRRSEEPPRSRQLTPPGQQAFPVWELPDFELIDQNGRPVTKSDLLDRPWVANFIFTRCTRECPMIKSRMQKLREELPAADARIVTITVDPKNDTPKVLNRQANALGAKPGDWLFLTGSEEDVYKLLREGFKVTAVQNTGEERQPGLEVNHSQSVMLVDEKGRVIGKYNGLDELEMERLRQAIVNR